MAEALSVVAENGIHGMEYNGLLESWPNRRGSRKSRRARISPFPAHTFSGQEFEDYLILAWRFGYLDRSRYKEVHRKAGPNKSSYEAEDEIIRLTKEGWEYLAENRSTRIERWLTNVVDNVPTIVVAVLLAYALWWLGLS